MEEEKRVRPKKKRNYELRLDMMFTPKFVDRNPEDKLLLTFINEKRCSYDKIGCYGSNKFEDLPPYYQYLTKTILMTTTPYHDFTFIIITQKYKELAIGYNPVLAKRPVVLFRKTFGHYNEIKLGDVLRVNLYKLFCVVNDIPKVITRIFTDLYAIVDSCQTLYLRYKTAIGSNGRVKVKEFGFDIKRMSQINGVAVIDTPFGLIVVPQRLVAFFSAEKLHSCSFIGALKYCLYLIERDRCACWVLADEFTVYKNYLPYGKFEKGAFQRFEEEDEALMVHTGMKPPVPYVKRLDVEKREECVHPYMKLDFWNHDGFISLRPERMRRIIR